MSNSYKYLNDLINLRELYTKIQDPASQSSLFSQEFLCDHLHLINDCESNYKNSKTMATSQSQQMYISEDLMLKILLLQPIKSLLRFKSVCKLWCRIISSQTFVDAHVKTSSNTQKYLLFDHSSCYSLCLVNNKTYSEAETINSEEYYLAKSFCSTAHWRVNIYGICKGLLCLSDDPLRINSPIYLWNPIVRKSKSLPDSKASIDPASGANLCFGYDNDDYKVIKLITTDVIRRLMFSIEVYSLSTNCWKIIYCERHNISYHSAVQLVKGALYFFNSAKNITSFDLSDETMREIKIPDEIVDIRTLTMEAYEESIVVMDFYPSTRRKYNCLVMWVLRQDGKGFYLWENKFNIEFEHGPKIGLKHNISVRSTDYSTLFFLWDIESRNWKDIRFPQEKQQYLFGIKSFKESLALLNQTSTTEPIRKIVYKTTTPSPSSCTIHVGGQITFISAADQFLDLIRM